MCPVRIMRVNLRSCLIRFMIMAGRRLSRRRSMSDGSLGTEGHDSNESESESESDGHRIGDDQADSDSDRIAIAMELHRFPSCIVFAA